MEFRQTHQTFKKKGELVFTLFKNLSTSTSCHSLLEGHGKRSFVSCFLESQAGAVGSVTGAGGGI